MKYHRLANAAIEPKRAVLSELKKVYDYADSFVGKFETISPRFVANMHRLVEIENNCMDIRRLLAKIGHQEAEYLRSVLKKHVVPGTFKLGKEGVMMDIRPLSAVERYNGDNEPFRLG